MPHDGGGSALELVDGHHPREDRAVRVVADPALLAIPEEVAVLRGIEERLGLDVVSPHADEAAAIGVARVLVGDVAAGVVTAVRVTDLVSEDDPLGEAEGGAAGDRPTDPDRAPLGVGGSGGHARDAYDAVARAIVLARRRGLEQPVVVDVGRRLVIGSHGAKLVERARPTVARRDLRGHRDRRVQGGLDARGGVAREHRALQVVDLSVPRLRQPVGAVCLVLERHQDDLQRAARGLGLEVLLTGSGPRCTADGAAGGCARGFVQRDGVRSLLDHFGLEQFEDEGRAGSGVRRCAGHMQLHVLGGRRAERQARDDVARRPLAGRLDEDADDSRATRDDGAVPIGDLLAALHEADLHRLDRGRPPRCSSRGRDLPSVSGGAPASVLDASVGSPRFRVERVRRARIRQRARCLRRRAPACPSGPASHRAQPA